MRSETDGARSRGSAGGSSPARRRFLARLQQGGIRDPRVLGAFASIDRELFVPDALRHRAYQDTPLPIGEGQTISAPDIVAQMSQALELDGSETVLEIGTGSAYQAAILSRLAGRVISIERVPRLAAAARRTLDACKVWNVVVHLGDGTQGRPQDGPYEAIVVTAGGPTLPEPLLHQLAPGGRLVGPFGERGAQRLVRVRRDASGRFSREVLGACRFVDLIGEHGWSA
ncbi:MAG: protein-L-isoaspartate(D-aspartate) O-methyltransferase [Myxococcota bacterium]